MTRSRFQPTRRFLAVASVTALTCVLLAAAQSNGKPQPDSPLLSRGRSAQGNNQPAEPPPGAAPTTGDEGRRPPRDGEHRPGDRGWGWRGGEGAGEFGGPPRGRMFDDEDVLKVIRDIAPEQAARVEESLKTKPEETRDYLRRSARRIMGLVVLSKNNPKLYDLKVKELRLQAEARRIAIEYHDLIASGRTEDAARAKDRLRAAAREAIDQGLRSRAEELAALTEAVRTFKQDLARDAANLDADAARLVDELTSHRPEGGMFSAIGSPPPSPPPSKPGSVGVPAGSPVDTAPEK